MKTYKVLSALLCYPEPELLAATDEMAAALKREQVLPERSREAVLGRIRGLKEMDLLELQQEYVALFDRGPALSLHLFEHLYGDSRERGQAMVDLLELYRQHGFEMNARELPDYLPLFLEYLSQRPEAEARDLLAGFGQVLALLAARLAERGSDYRHVLEVLADLAGQAPGMGPAARSARERPAG